MEAIELQELKSQKSVPADRPLSTLKNHHEVLLQVLTSQFTQEASSHLQKSLSLLETLAKNILESPEVLKFRRVRCNQPAIQRYIGQYESGSVILHVSALHSFLGSKSNQIQMTQVRSATVCTQLTWNYSSCK